MLRLRDWAGRRGKSLGLSLLACTAAAATLVFVAHGTAQDPATVEITAGPSDTVASSDGTFEFSSSDPSATFECSLDAREYTPCSSPEHYSGLVDGDHFFSVRIAGADGADAQATGTRHWTVENALPCTGADQPANFPVYSFGPSVQGLDVSSISRRCEEPDPNLPGRANFVSYTYGVCPQLEDGTSEACPPPLEIQSWPACERSLADYELSPGTPYPHEELGTRDGVPAYSFDGGTRVELYAGTATIVIFTTDPSLIDDALAAIQREPDSERPGEPVSSQAADGATQGPTLPDPAPGALSGDLSCT